MLDMSAMDTLLRVDVERQRITMQPGLLLGRLLDVAWEEGWRVRSVTALKKITVGGMLAVGAHGNDTGAATFSDDIVGLSFVDGTGTLRTVDEQELRELRAAQINLGALGVVVSLTLQCHPSGLFHYQTDILRHEDVATQEQIDAIVQANDLVEIYWFPFIDKVQVLRWNVCEPGEQPAFLPRYGWQDRLRNWLVQNVGQFFVGSPIAFFVDRVMPSAGWLLVWLSSHMFSNEECLQTPTDAGHYLYAYHKVRDSGWAVPAETTADALEVYARMIEAYEADGHYPVNICVHMRFIRAGDALLGFASGEDRKNPEALLCQIEAAMTAHADQAVPYLKHVEQAFLLPYFKGRPHWAKEWWVDVHPFALGGSAAWKAFRAWRDKFDPKGIFANKLIRAIDDHVDEVERLLAESPTHDLDEVRNRLVQADDRVREVLDRVFG